LCFLQPFRLPRLFSKITRGDARGLLQLSGFQPEKLGNICFSLGLKGQNCNSPWATPRVQDENLYGSLKGCRRGEALQGIMQQGRLALQTRCELKGRLFRLW